MIDNLPQASPAIPAFAAPPAAPAATAAATPGQPTPGAQSAEDFSSTLQQRLQKLLAVGKAASRGDTPKAAASNTEDAQRLHAMLNAHMRGQAAPVAALPAETATGANASADASAAAAASGLLAAMQATDPSAKAKEEGNDSQGNGVLPSPDTAALALSVVAAPVTPPPNPVAAQPNLREQRGDLASGTRPGIGLDQSPIGNQGERGQAGNNATDAAPPAILAAGAEKNDALPKTPLPETGKESTFASVLKGIDSTGTHQATQVPAAQSPLPAPAASVPAREVASPLASVAWSQDVGNQVSWMVNQRESRADLVLNPPTLGRIEVSITLNGDQASANFVSANPEVRDALQNSLPRLREVLADAGVFLGQADIGSRSSSQGGNDAEKGRNSPRDSFASANGSLLGSINDPATLGSSSSIARGQGLIDLFA